MCLTYQVSNLREGGKNATVMVYTLGAVCQTFKVLGDMS